MITDLGSLTLICVLLSAKNICYIKELMFVFPLFLLQNQEPLAKVKEIIV